MTTLDPNPVPLESDDDPIVLVPGRFRPFAKMIDDEMDANGVGTFLRRRTLAEVLCVSLRSIDRYVKRGKLSPHHYEPNGWPVFRRSEVACFVALHCARFRKARPEEHALAQSQAYGDVGESTGFALLDVLVAVLVVSVSALLVLA